jgi:hypothetical protein
MEVLQKAGKDGHLSEVSIKHYGARLKRLSDLCGKPVDHVIVHPDETIKVIKANQGEVQTQRASVNAILSVYKYSPDLKCANQAKYAKFKKFFEEVSAEMTERYDNNEPSERQKEAYMPYAEVIRKRDALDHKSIEYLILCLYTMIPPLRADFGNVRIMKSEPKEDAKNKGNYLVVKKSYMRLVLNEFKSKSKHMERYDKVLPRDLENVIRESLTSHPRTHLIVSPRTEKPFERDNTFIVYTGRILEKALGKPVTISMMRHIYVSSLDMNKLTSGEKKEMSRDMLHSVETNDRYRLKF